MDERTQPEELSEDLLAEAEAESDLLDADIEEPQPAQPVGDRARIDPSLSDEDLVEADAQADLVDPDVEDV